MRREGVTIHQPVTLSPCRPVTLSSPLTLPPGHGLYSWAIDQQTKLEYVMRRLTIGDVAELFEVTPKTLRHYEKVGLIRPERAENGYREYSPADILRLNRVRQLQSLGLSLKQIKEVLERQGDDELWTMALQALHDEAVAEIERLEARRERLEALLAADAQRKAEALPPVPEKVSHFLEEHLEEAQLEAWRHDVMMMAALGEATVPQNRPAVEIDLAQLLFAPFGVLPEPVLVTGRVEEAA